MSLSTQTTTEIVPNIVKKTFSWKGSVDANHLEIYDKDVYNKVTKEKGSTDLIRILVIDQYVGITGFNQKYKTSMWSNGVKSTTKEILTVRINDLVGKKQIIVAEGLYQDIKPTLNSVDAKYTKILYGVELDQSNNISNHTPVCIKLSTSAVPGFLSLTVNPGTVLEISKSDTLTTEKGKVDHYRPKYTIIPSDLIPKDTMDSAKIIDESLQANFRARADISEADEEVVEPLTNYPTQTVYETEVETTVNTDILDIAPIKMPF